MPNITLTAVLITKNEESKIRRCLASIKDLASEIIVIDDESTDSTPKIARDEFNAKVIVHASQSNFDRQRNLGIEAAANAWILQMDADEEISAETAAAIKNALSTNTEFSAFTLTRRDCVFGVPIKHAPGEPATKLFRKDKARYVGNKIHETLEVDGQISAIDTDILHYNFDSIRQVLARWNHYTDVESKAYLKENGPKDLKFLKKRLLSKSIKLFYKHYFKSKVYKDGVHGLIWAVLHVISPLIFWLKVLEKEVKDDTLS